MSEQGEITEQPERTRRRVLESLNAPDGLPLMQSSVLTQDDWAALEDTVEGLQRTLVQTGSSGPMIALTRIVLEHEAWLRWLARRFFLDAEGPGPQPPEDGDGLEPSESWKADVEVARAVEAGWRDARAGRSLPPEEPFKGSLDQAWREGYGRYEAWRAGRALADAARQALAGEGLTPLASALDRWDRLHGLLAEEGVDRS